MSVGEDELARQAEDMLSQNDQALPGMNGQVNQEETKVSILGTNFTVGEKFALGERVELRVVGYVGFEGQQVVGEEDTQRVAKVQASLIERVHE